MKIFTPNSSIEYAERNSLLQKSLRDEARHFSIESEYPIVLSKDGNRFSYCYRHESELVAHANLWPRVVTCSITKQRWQIGLIGNVATDERFRGRGIMSNVLEHLKSVATDNNLSILILWSDLLEFYQKQGFRSFGEERRYIYTRESLAQILRDQTVKSVFFNKHEIKRISDVVLDTFIDLRPKTGLTINRTTSEFTSLLNIPNLNVFSSSDNSGRITAFAILGKGADMESVVHEWGGETASDILDLLGFILANSDRDATMLLSPKILPKQFYKELERFSAEKEKHSMALAWTHPALPKKDLKQLEELFIWGLDSI
jgi:N-acetylglutamate synthase-like GNAT family acetyltransferase